MEQFDGLKKHHYGAIYADPPWSFKVWNEDTGGNRSASAHYSTQDIEWIKSLPVSDLAAQNCVLFMWFCWPSLPDALEVIKAWGFEYKTCAFSWTKADARQVEMFQDYIDPYMGMGYYTRANCECVLLAIKGNPIRLNADVRQAIIEPRREHSRKPSCIYERIERLVSGPYVELFARNQRNGWSSWGNEIKKFAEVK